MKKKSLHFLKDFLYLVKLVKDLMTVQVKLMQKYVVVVVFFR